MTSKIAKERNGVERQNCEVVQDCGEDADYKPILRGIINTRCNYDGAKIEGALEQ